jgi:hypothetical protein
VSRSIEAPFRQPSYDPRAPTSPIVRLPNRHARVEDGGPVTIPTAKTLPEESMLGRLYRTSDPFEGKGARRKHFRLRAEGFIAFALAVAACGLTAAMWLRILAEPLAQRLGMLLG